MGTSVSYPRDVGGEVSCLAQGRCLAQQPEEARLCFRDSICARDYKARTGMLPARNWAEEDDG